MYCLGDGGHSGASSGILLTPSNIFVARYSTNTAPIQHVPVCVHVCVCACTCTCYFSSPADINKVILCDNLFDLLCDDYFDLSVPLVARLWYFFDNSVFQLLHVVYLFVAALL